MHAVFVRSGLIPGPIGARCVTVDHLQLDLGSANTPAAAGGGNSRELADPIQPEVVSGLNKN